MKMIIRCNRCPRVTELFYCKSVDEYLCEDCIETINEKNEDK